MLRPPSRRPQRALLLAAVLAAALPALAAPPAQAGVRVTPREVAPEGPLRVVATCPDGDEEWVRATVLVPELDVVRVVHVDDAGRARTTVRVGSVVAGRDALEVGVRCRSASGEETSAGSRRVPVRAGDAAPVAADDPEVPAVLPLTVLAVVCLGAFAAFGLSRGQRAAREPRRARR